MADRETVEFKTKSGKHTAKLLTYLTRKERRQVTAALFGNKELNVDGKNDVKTSISMDATSQAEDKTIELAVVELDGSAENVLARYLELPDQEADEIKNKIDELTGVTDSEKKDAGASTTKG